ncbi:MAG: glycosyltransferase [Acidimicrobiia bacterium]|nr:glycosyltransferase [Acidimicrobiia bacterium]
MKPTILIFIKGLGIGGAERLISDGAEFWDRDRFDYRVAYVLPWKNQVVPDLDAFGVSVRCIGTDNGMRPSVVPRLRRLIRDWDVDLVHAHLPTTGVLARLFARVPVVYTEHNMESSYRAPTRQLNRWTYSRNAAVTAVSEAVAESLEGFPGPPVRVVENGVSARLRPPEAAAARDELGISSSDPLVCHVGNIRPHKGHSNLIAAAAILKDRIPNLTIVSIGGEKHAGDLARIQAEAAHAGVADVLRFLGRKTGTEARAFMEAANVYVNPADFEGLPVSILEAMALGRAVVATNVGGVPSVITHETGVLVPPKDPRALADATADLLTDSERAGALGKSAKALAEGSYGLDRMVGRLEAIYTEVLA